MSLLLYYLPLYPHSHLVIYPPFVVLSSIHVLLLLLLLLLLRHLLYLHYFRRRVVSIVMYLQFFWLSIHSHYSTAIVINFGGIPKSTIPIPFLILDTITTAITAH